MIAVFGVVYVPPLLPPPSITTTLSVHAQNYDTQSPRLRGHAFFASVREAILDINRTAAAVSASTPSVLNGMRLMRNSNSQATTAAQAVVGLFYQGVQLPPSLAQYAGLFTGLFTGALGGFALRAYFQRNKCNKAKVKLAIHHILRVIQEDSSYNAMLQDPQALLSRIETEVMRLVEKHLTLKEAAQVTKAVKRNYCNVPFDESVNKRIRADYRDFLKERQGPVLTAAYQPQRRGSVSPAEVGLPCEEDVPDSWTTSKAIYQSLYEAAERCDSLVEQSDEELGLEDDLMVIDKVAPSSSGIPHVPDHLFGGSSCPTSRLLIAPSAPQSIFVGRVNTSMPQLDEKDDGYESDVDGFKSPEPAGATAQVAGGLQVVKSIRHAPQSGSYGLDYDNEDLYSDADDDFRPSGPPPVMRQLDGEKCSGTQLSPIPGSPWRAEDLSANLSLENWSREAEFSFSSSESERENSPRLPSGVNMSTVSEQEFSSSEFGSPGATSISSRSPAASPESAVVAAFAQEKNVCASEEKAGGPQTSSPFPSRKRKSVSLSPNSISKRAHRSSSPLADVTNGPSTPNRRASTSPAKEPLKKGRGRTRKPLIDDTPRRASRRLQDKKQKKKKKKKKDM